MNKLIFSISLLRKDRIFASLTILSMIFSSAALLADEESQQQRADDQTINQSQESDQDLRITGSYPNIYKATGIIGKEVKNKQNKKLGEISDLVIDKSGQVRYAVLSHGETLGVGGKKIAISWDLIQVSPEEESYALVMDAMPEELANAPSFNKDNWPANAQVTDTSSLKGQQQSSTDENQSTYQQSTNEGSQYQQRGSGSATPKTVRVESGDTLANIAQRVYGDSGKWQLIYEANEDKIDNPRELLTGTILTIPSPEE